MKPNIKILSLLGIAALVILQITWLSSNYALTKESLQKTFTIVLRQSMSEELNLRCIIDADKVPIDVPLVTVTDSSENVSNTEVQLQESLARYGSEVSLPAVDSIVSRQISLMQFSTPIVICLVNANDSILKSSRELLHSYKILKTGKLPIRLNNSLFVQGFMLHPYRVVFKQMTLLLLSTVLIMLFVTWCVIYQVKVLLAERHISQWKDTFSRAMIHDMKTPIAGIKMSTQLLRNIQPNEINERDEIISYIEKENEQLYSLAEKVLTIARIESGKVCLHKQDFSLHKIVNDLINKYKSRTTKDVTFRIKLQQDIAYGEAEYIKEAISNLIDNALKYSGEKVEIEILSETRNEMLCISVKDNGWGIARSERNRIFEKFEQGSNARKRRISGFGLGLNYVKEVAEAHGGRADMMSRKGYGSIFMIIIPTKTNREKCR